MDTRFSDIAWDSPGLIHRTQYLANHVVDETGELAGESLLRGKSEGSLSVHATNQKIQS